MLAVRNVFPAAGVGRVVLIVERTERVCFLDCLQRFHLAALFFVRLRDGFVLRLILRGDLLGCQLAGVQIFELFAVDGLDRQQRNPCPGILPPHRSS